MPALLPLLLTAGAAQLGMDSIRARNERTRSRRIGGILDELGPDADVRDIQRAGLQAGIFSPEQFIEGLNEDFGSNRDFLEELQVQAQADNAAMDRTRANIARDYGIEAMRQGAQNMQERLARAQELATGGSFGIGAGTGSNQDRTSLTVYNPNERYQVGTALDAARQAISTIESTNDYSAVGPVVERGQYAGEQALGAYQVMPGNLKVWSQEVFGREVSPEEYLSRPDLQDQLFDKKFGDLLDRYGFADAASIWHSGRTLEEAARDGANDGYIDTVDYVQRSVGAFENIANANIATAQAFTPELRDRVMRTERAIKVGSDLIDFAQGGLGRALNREEINRFRTEAELTFIPALQGLVDSGVLNTGELEQFKEWMGDPAGVRLTDADIGKIRGVMRVLEADTRQTLAANGVDPRLLQLTTPQGAIAIGEIPEPTETYTPQGRVTIMGG